jgi:hypothetical protein
VVTDQLHVAEHDRHLPVVPCELPDGIQLVYVDDRDRRQVVALEDAAAVALRNAVRAAANDVRRIRRAMADFDAAGMEIADDVELDNLLAELHAVADEVADARRNPPTVLHPV